MAIAIITADTATVPTASCPVATVPVGTVLAAAGTTAVAAIGGKAVA
jgi:hypothetical protein